MIYQSGDAFRQALERRLITKSRQDDIPLSWLRKMVAFDRFLTRLVKDRPEDWLLKGGMALQLRLGMTARTTKDLDLLMAEDEPDIQEELVRAALLELDDWFRFTVRQPSRSTDRNWGISRRFYVSALVAGRSFENFHVDVGMDEPIVGVPEPFSMLPLLEFAGIKSATILCYPIVQQIADKVHAYTRPRPAGISTRVKDVIDILLIARVQTLQRTSLHSALEATFSYYNTHPLPMILPDPPVSWMTQFRQLARTTDLAYTTPAEAVDAMRSLVEPALQGAGNEHWNPLTWSWESLP